MEDEQELDIIRRDLAALGADVTLIRAHLQKLAGGKSPCGCGGPPPARLGLTTTELGILVALGAWLGWELYGFVHGGDE